MTQHVAVDHSTPEDRSARARIGAAGKLLRDNKSDVPDGFAALMFARTAPEDLVRYDAAELAALAGGAWSFFAVRKAGAPKIRFESPDASLGDRLKTISVIEIVNDDMPFLVNSVMAELAERGLDVRLVAHPIVAVERDKGGKLKSAPQETNSRGGEPRESFIHIHVERIADNARRAEIVQSLEQVLAQVRLAVQDWRPMLSRVEGVIKELKSNPPPVPVDDIAEAVQFLEWLAADNFTLLGVREHAFTGKSRELAPVKDTELGFLRSGSVPVFTRGGKAVTVTPQLRAFFDEPKTLIVMKANVKSRVHRRVYLDYVGVKRFDADGNAIGEFRILGLFTSTAYTRSVRTIPYLRRKVDATLRRAGFDPDGHSGKALVNVLEGYPRDELFQIDDDTLYEFSLAILQLEERPRVRVLARPRPFRSFRFGAGLRAARAVRFKGPRADRRLARRGLQRSCQRVLSDVPGRRHRPRSLHHRPQGRRDARSGPRHAGAGGWCDRPHLERHAGRQACRDPGAGTGPGAVRALWHGVLGGLSRGLSAGGCA